MKKFITLLSIAALFVGIVSCDDEKVLEGEDNFKPTDYTVKGKVEKGPFVSGSTINMQPMDAKLVPTGSTFSSAITDNAGNFAFNTATLETPYAQLTANGYFFNEITGQLSNGTLSLRAIADLSEQSTVNVNILTHLKYARIMDLVEKENMTYKDANKQAQRELLTQFGLQRFADTDASNYSITTGTPEAGALIAISSLLLLNRSEAQITEYLAKLSLEFGENGSFGDETKNTIKNDRNNIWAKLRGIENNIRKRYEDLGQPITVVSLDDYFDWDDDGIAGNEGDRIPERTVLVYMAADNNLSYTANSNIYSMNSTTWNYYDNNNLIVFVDRKDVNPVLLKLNRGQIDTIRVYQELNSADPTTLADVIGYVKDNYETESYGLVLWGHGMGWLPISQYHFVAPNLRYAPTRDYAANRGQTKATKAYAYEQRAGETPAYTGMDLDGLADAIPDGLFDFIAFDACYMGNIEIIYALRNKAKSIISNCHETVSYGFPYHIVTKDFLNGDLINVCNEFYNYYNSMSGWEQTAGISLVNTEGLDSLARCFKKIMAVMNDSVAGMDVSNIQCFDRFSNHVFFDLEDFVANLNVSREYLTEFRLQMEECVKFKISTPYIFPGDKEEIKVNSYCGMSVYVPLFQYEASGLNDDYRKTEWSKNTAYIGTQINESEIAGTWDATNNWTYVFNNDHTGSRTTRGRTQTFTWSLAGNELEIVFSNYDGQESGILVYSIFTIQSISDTKIEVYDKDDSSKSIIVFQKKR